MHPKLTALGEASLKGWRGRVSRPLADAVARRTDYSADQVRAVIGLALSSPSPSTSWLPPCAGRSSPKS